MQIKVKLFAILRDRAGTSDITLEIPRGSAASVALDSIATKFSTIKDLLPRAAIAINREYASRDAALNDGDELALIPPVSGG